ncbi:MAG: YegP family protein [Kofleriaceae bacterium]
MSGYYVLEKKSSKFHFVLKAGNHETILSSQGYTTRAAATGGIASCRTNASKAAAFERKVAKNGQHYFVLHAANKQVIGQSETYTSAAGRDKGIASVQRNAATKTVKDLTEA